jgi:hypothetical protein
LWTRRTVRTVRTMFPARPDGQKFDGLPM